MELIEIKTIVSYKDEQGEGQLYSRSSSSWEAAEEDFGKLQRYWERLASGTDVFPIEESMHETVSREELAEDNL